MKKTVLNPVHRDLEGRLVEYGGFEMPVQYTSIVDEHLAVRGGAGLFDLCHMGRYEFTGSDAVAAVDRLISNDVARMKPGAIRYALMCNDAGGVRDDVLVYRLPDRVWLVVNAGNRDKLLPWIDERLSGDDVQFQDRSEELAMIALQGPDSEGLLESVVATTWVDRLPDLGYYAISDARITVGGATYEGWVSRTGYTGEDGFELYVPASGTCDLWQALRDHGGERITPCGLGSRDTLRLEAGMPLYGHELDEETNPLEAGLRFAVKLKKASDYIGREALTAIKAQGPTRRLAGFRVDGRRVARYGMPVRAGGEQVGTVTSGAPSPTLGCNIALAYVPADLPAEAALDADVRGKSAPLVPHEVPFYSRTRGS